MEGSTGAIIGTPLREGYVFKGWNTEQKGTGIPWTPGETPMPNYDVILYAQWLEKGSADNVSSENKDNNSIASKSDSSEAGKKLPSTGGYNIYIVTTLLIGIGSQLLFRRYLKK